MDTIHKSISQSKRNLILISVSTPVCPLSTYVYTPSVCKRGFLHQIHSPLCLAIA